MTDGDPIIYLSIDAVAHGGDGLGRLSDGKVCFVPFALPGDRVRARIYRRTATAVWARLLEVIAPSPYRAEFIGDNPEMAEAYVWGCFGYPGQAEWKQRIVRECLSRIGGVEIDVEWVEELSLRLGYRTRAEFHGDGDHFGLYAAGSHRIVPMFRCPLCHGKVNEAFGELAAMRARGSIMITVHPEGDDVMVWTPPAELERVRARFPMTNARDEKRPPSVFMMDGTPVVNGGFSQSSLLLNRILLGLVREMAGEPKSVLDLYCGNGNLSLWLARRGIRVEGYDHAQQTVVAADMLGLGGYCRGGEQEMTAAIQANRHDTVILDPPRSGAAELMPALAKCGLERIVYVSCDPATLARDVKILKTGGWNVKRAVAVDMFPYTPHVETVCMLLRDGEGVMC